MPPVVGVRSFLRAADMAHLVVTTMGSWGDLFPAVGLAAEASARGHSVTVAATPAYAGLLEAERLPVAHVGPRFGPEEFAADPAILDGRRGGFAGFLHVFRTYVFPNLREWVEDLRRTLDGADLLVAHPAVAAAPIAAELAGVPWATFSLFPGLIPSAHTLPSPTRAPLPPGGAGRLLRRSAWAAARRHIAGRFDAPVNATRASFGLPPIRDALFLPVDSGNPYVVGTSAHVVAPPPDWPPNVQLTGYFAWDTPRALRPPPELDAFLEAGPPPVLVTLGGSSAVDPQGFYADAVAAARRLDHRVLVLGGATPAPVALEPEPDVFVCRFAPLTAVAHRCSAAIHHGGIGTTVALLAAGLPQLIVPRSFDQPQTALRMQRLGVARSVPWGTATADRLARELGAVLRDARTRLRAGELAERLRSEDGRRRAVDALEASLSRR
jgi:UDP:flavonoid glycosyltransferase YjiC (YdhE family)